MWELRWALLALGIVFIAGLYLWGRGTLRRLQLSRPEADPEEPVLGAVAAQEEREESTQADAKDEPVQRPDRVITVRFIPKDGELSCERAVLALRQAGLQHGKFGIFHSRDDRQESLFCVANLTEPGSFDLTKIGDRTIPGMSFFMVLPGVGDPVARFDLMVQTARSLAHDLDAELHDEKGSSWSIQRERYVREEIIRYRHQLECAPTI